jgi:hypothetical protein
MDDGLIIKDRSELGEVMDNLDNDNVNPETKQSPIDFNTRLSETNIPHITIVDSVISIGIYPPFLKNLTGMIKRLKVSKDGLGRQEKVAIVQGQRELNSGNRISSAFANLFSRKD